MSADTFTIFNSIDPNLNLILPDPYKTNQIKKFMSQFVLSDQIIQEIHNQFCQEMEDRLNQTEDLANHDTTVLGMKITFLTELFNGQEEGSCIVIHLNSDYLLLVLAEIRPGFPVKLKTRERFVVGEEIRRSPYIGIFVFICDCLQDFFTKNNLLNEVQTVGFCSDAPMSQFGLVDATVWYFTPTASDFPLNSYDFKRCLERVLLKERYRNVKVHLVTILNNRTSEFVFSSYVCGPVDMFLHFGNEDCDELYFEEGDTKWVTNKEDKVLVDVELRNFGGNGFLKSITTDHDIAAERACASSLGHRNLSLKSFLSIQRIRELVKIILLELHHDLHYCRSTSVGPLQENGVTLTDLHHLIELENLDHLKTLLPGRTVNCSEEDAQIAKYVCGVILSRDAILKAICISGALARVRQKDGLVAVDSPLMHKSIKCETYVRNALQCLAPDFKVQFLYVVDGENVLRGAALATLLASRLPKNHF